MSDVTTHPDARATAGPRRATPTPIPRCCSSPIAGAPGRHARAAGPQTWRGDHGCRVASAARGPVPPSRPPARRLVEHRHPTCQGRGSQARAQGMTSVQTRAPAGLASRTGWSLRRATPKPQSTACVCPPHRGNPRHCCCRGPRCVVPAGSCGAVLTLHSDWHAAHGRKCDAGGGGWGHRDGSEFDRHVWVTGGGEHSPRADRGPALLLDPVGLGVTTEGLLWLWLACTWSRALVRVNTCGVGGTKQCEGGGRPCQSVHTVAHLCNTHTNTTAQARPAKPTNLVRRPSTTATTATRRCLLP